MKMRFNEFGKEARCNACGGSGKVVNHASVGAWVRGYRERKTLSACEVAKAVGISASYLSDLELGRRNWTAELFDRVMEQM